MLLHSQKAKLTFLSLLPFLLLALLVQSLVSGTIDINIKDIIEYFLGGDIVRFKYIVLQNLRIPRALIAIGVGGGLSLSGLFVQTLFRNPLVEPYTLGISGGASLGVAIMVAFFGGVAHNYSLSAFIGAMVVAIILWIIASQERSESRLLLFGVMISFISSSFLVLIFALVNSTQLQKIIFWTMGSLEPSGRFDGFFLIIISLFFALVSTLMGRQLNMIKIGQEESIATGINISVLRITLLGGATILTALAVSISGVIGFVGLIIPHLVRLLWGDDHRFTIVATWFLGSSFLLLTDTVSRTIVAPTIVPIGAVTGLVGGVLFISLLLHSRIKK